MATPFQTLLDVELNGERYHALSAPLEQGGARTWTEITVPEQQADPAKEITVDLDDFSQGAGFSFGQMPGVYEIANGWDASAPGKIVTWPRHAVGGSQTTTAAKGWLRYHGGYLWMFRDKYVTKHSPDDTHGGTWAQVNTAADLTGTLAGCITSGKPTRFRGSGVAGTKLYIPTTVAGTPGRFIELTTVASGASADTYTLGPNTAEAQCFTVWRERLVLAELNTIRTCTADPMTIGNWSAAITVGSADYSVTGLATWGPYLIVARPDGLFTLDENLRPVNEIPDIEAVIDSFNGYGMQFADGAIKMPHKLGLINWSPGGYEFIGVEQEGALDGSLSDGWGRYVAVAPYGKYTFFVSSDYTNNKGALGSFQPGQSRKPYTPHIHHTLTSGTYEDLEVLSLASSSPAAYIPTTWSDDSAVGTLTWSSTGSAAAEDGQSATVTFSGSAISHYLKGLDVANGASIVPTDATVVGVKVRIKKSVA